MCDIFTRDDIHKLLRGKSCLFLGDSIMRNLYKDLVWLTTTENPRQLFLRTMHMAKKGEQNLAGLVNEKLIHKSYETGRHYKEQQCFY